MKGWSRWHLLARTLILHRSHQQNMFALLGEMGHQARAADVRRVPGRSIHLRPLVGTNHCHVRPFARIRWSLKRYDGKTRIQHRIMKLGLRMELSSDFDSQVQRDEGRQMLPSLTEVKVPSPHSNWYWANRKLPDVIRPPLLPRASTLTQDS